jgi:hypothetical protein
VVVKVDSRGAGKSSGRLDIKGVGWFTHDDPADRPVSSFAGFHTIHTGRDRQSYLLLPVIPAS